MNHELYQEIIDRIVESVIDEVGFEHDVYDLLSEEVSSTEQVMFYGEAKELIAFIDQDDPGKLAPAYEEATHTLPEDYNLLCVQMAYHILMADVCKEYESALELSRTEEECYE